MLSVSALRGTAGTGILWAVRRDTNGVGTLDAYDATNVAVRLYSSNTNSARDNFGTGSRLGHFTVADGKVFVPTFSRQVVAYGLLSTPALTSVAVTPANPTGQAGATQQFTATGTYSDNTTKDITSQVTGLLEYGCGHHQRYPGSASTVGAGTTTISALQGGITGTTTLTVQAPPSVSTATLPNGTVGVPYSATLSATGGTHLMVVNHVRYTPGWIEP